MNEVHVHRMSKDNELYLDARKHEENAGRISLSERRTARLVGYLPNDTMSNCWCSAVLAAPCSVLGELLGPSKVGGYRKGSLRG